MEAGEEFIDNASFFNSRESQRSIKNFLGLYTHIDLVPLRPHYSSS